MIQQSSISFLQAVIRTAHQESSTVILSSLSILKHCTWTRLLLQSSAHQCKTWLKECYIPVSTCSISQVVSS